ncbi:MAG: hypothetical protein AB8F95_08410 [Bacteroidia bacterium]
MNNKDYKIAKTLLTLLIILAGANIGICQEKIQTSTAVDTIPFELTDHNNIKIQAVLGDADTLDLMFHTAAGSISLTTSATEKLKGIHWDTETEVGSWGGRANTRYSANNAITIGALHWDSVEIWEDEHSGPGTDGKFGPSLFEGYVIEVDFDKNVLILHDSLPPKADGYVKVPVNIDRGMLFIEGTSTIDGVNYKNQFLVHSGYGGALLYDDKFAAESRIGERIEIIDEKELKDSFGNVVKINKGSLPTLTIGNAALTDVPVGFFQGKIGRQQMSVIGGDLLKRFNIILDADRTCMYLNPNRLKDIAYTQF